MGFEELGYLWGNLQICLQKPVAARASGNSAFIPQDLNGGLQIPAVSAHRLVVLVLQYLKYGG